MTKIGTVLSERCGYLGTRASGLHPAVSDWYDSPFRRFPSFPTWERKGKFETALELTPTNHFDVFSLFYFLGYCREKEELLKPSSVPSDRHPVAIAYGIILHAMTRRKGHSQ